MSKIESKTAKFRRLITDGTSFENAIEQSGVTEGTAHVQLHNMRKQGISQAVAAGSRRVRTVKPKIEAGQPEEEEELDIPEEGDESEEF